VHQSDPDVMLNGLVLKKCPVCVISEEIWSTQEIWAPTSMSTDKTHGCYRARAACGLVHRARLRPTHTLAALVDLDIFLKVITTLSSIN